jgi:hypothetical protein
MRRTAVRLLASTRLKAARNISICTSLNFSSAIISKILTFSDRLSWDVEGLLCILSFASFSS